MKEQFEEYVELLIRLINLQQELVQVFETEAEVVEPLPPEIPKNVGEKLKNTIKPGYSISQILRIWPVDVGVLPLFLWVRPGIGIMQFEGQNWHFYTHGSIQVTFRGLPSGLETQVLASLKEGNMELLSDLSGVGPTVDVTYLKEGRTDGINSWTMFLFAQSIDSKFSTLPHSDHERYMESLIKEGVLVSWPNCNLEGSGQFVLAPG